MADRDETKFLISELVGKRMAALVGERLPLLSSPGGTQITSVYFDTPGREIFAAARSDGRSIKVRVKEYEARPDDDVWLELKLREGERTGKLRVPVARARVLDVIARPDATRGPLFEELARLRATLAGPLEPVCTVAYRRLAWETADASIRVTLDTGIRFASAPKPPWGSTSLAARSPDPGVAFEEGAILELKLRVPVPDWLAPAVEALAGARSPFSKFVAGSQAQPRTA